jgi:predicted nucleic acid-binding protein
MAEPDDPVIRVVVCDAGPLIHLDELGCLNLLTDFSDVLVPAKVWAEVGRHRPGVVSQRSVPFHQVEAGTELSPDLAAIAQLFALDAGELEALQVVREHSADLLLSDDTAARLAAQSLSIPVHGTVGILVRSIRRGQKSAVDVVESLRQLPALSTLHIKFKLLEDIIKQVETTS